MKKQLAIILCLVMLISVVFSGCGAESIVGSWKGTVDMTDYLNEQITAGDETMAEYFNFSNIAVDVTMTFNEDGTCAIVFDEASVEQMMETLVDQMLPGLATMMEDLSGMSFDDLLAMSGMSEDEYVESIMSEAMSSMDMSELNLKANYKAENGKLYIADDLDDEVDEDTTSNPYTLNGDTLTIEASEAGEDMDFMFPLVLKKAG